MWWKQLWFNEEGREGRVALVPGGRVWSASGSASGGQEGGSSCNLGFCSFSKMVGQTFRGEKLAFWCLTGLGEVYGSIMPVEEYCESVHMLTVS